MPTGCIYLLIYLIKINLKIKIIFNKVFKLHTQGRWCSECENAPAGKGNRDYFRDVKGEASKCMKPGSEYYKLAKSYRLQRTSRRRWSGYEGPSGTKRPRTMRRTSSSSRRRCGIARRRGSVGRRRLTSYIVFQALDENTNLRSQESPGAVYCAVDAA